MKIRTEFKDRDDVICYKNMMLNKYAKATRACICCHIFCALVLMISSILAHEGFKYLILGLILGVISVVLSDFKIVGSAIIGGFYILLILVSQNVVTGYLIFGLAVVPVNYYFAGKYEQVDKIQIPPEEIKYKHWK
jgi:hypothetical protein